MVDVDTVKPGDVVVLRFDGGPNSGSYQTRFYVSDELDYNRRHIVKSGDFFEVADPALDEYRRCIRLKHASLPSGFARCDPERFDLACQTDLAILEERSCRCDIMSLMRVGCRCGHLDREREAALAAGVATSGDAS